MSSLNWNHFDEHQAHLADLRRDAERMQMARKLRATRPANPALSAVMTALGRQFVRFGTRLQDQYAAPQAHTLTPAGQG